MDRETIVSEMTDMKEPALAYIPQWGNHVLSPLHDARKTLSELGKEEEEEAMPITGHTINLTNLNKKKPT